MKVKKKAKRKSKRSVRFLRFGSELFFLSAILYLGSSLFLRTYNNGIASSISVMNNEIIVVEKQNDCARADVRTLTAQNGVTTAADGRPALAETIK
jgi:hypothetical protein